MSRAQPVPVDQIEIRHETQLREGIVPAMVDQYAECMKAGDLFPPIVVFGEAGTDTFILADGFHRLGAARQIGHCTIDCDIRSGGLREAMLYATGANGTHGMSRSIEEKRSAVLVLLRDPEWSRWTDREIARRCYVSHPFVSKLRADPGTVLLPPVPAETNISQQAATGLPRLARSMPGTPRPQNGFSAVKRFGNAIDALPEATAVAGRLSKKKRALWNERASKLATWFGELAEATQPRP